MTIAEQDRRKELSGHLYNYESTQHVYSSYFAKSRNKPAKTFHRLGHITFMKFIFIKNSSYITNVPGEANSDILLGKTIYMIF